MTQQEYYQKKRECLEEFANDKQIQSVSIPLTFLYAFDKGYALGKLQASCGQVKETVSQEEIEKAADEYVRNNQFTHPYSAIATRESYKDGIYFALGKQEKDADVVIQGWIARDEDENLFVYHTKPERDETTQMWMGGCVNFDLRNHLFPDLTWESEPLEVEIIIKRKKNG